MRLSGIVKPFLHNQRYWANLAQISCNLVAVKSAGASHSTTCFTEMEFTNDQ